VVDASVALSALLNAGPARSALASEQLHTPHLIDSEVANGLRRRVAAQVLVLTPGGPPWKPFDVSGQRGTWCSHSWIGSEKCGTTCLSTTPRTSR
jgi:hypothetical protein